MYLQYPARPPSIFNLNGWDHRHIHIAIGFPSLFHPECRQRVLFATQSVATTHTHDSPSQAVDSPSLLPNTESHQTNEVNGCLSADSSIYSPQQPNYSDVCLICTKKCPFPENYGHEKNFACAVVVIVVPQILILF